MTTQPNYPSAESLSKLSEEVGRIASTLARLSANSDRLSDAETTTGVESPHVSLETVRRVIRTRRLRGSYFPADLFADPAWDMMLELLRAEIAQQRVSISSLSIASEVPPTTALRWQKEMVERGLLIQRPDPRDRRRVFVELTPQASHAMRVYFAKIDRISTSESGNGV